MLNQCETSHGVMEGGGFYNRYARIPAGGGGLALPFLEQAVKNIAIDSRDQPVKHLTFASPAPQLRDACTARENYGHLTGVGVGPEQDRQNWPHLPAH